MLRKQIIDRYLLTKSLWKHVNLNIKKILMLCFKEILKFYMETENQIP